MKTENTDISKFTTHLSCVNQSTGHRSCQILIRETQIIYETPILMAWLTLLENLPLYKREGNSRGERLCGGKENGNEGRGLRQRVINFTALVETCLCSLLIFEKLVSIDPEKCSLIKKHTHASISYTFHIHLCLVMLWMLGLFILLHHQKAFKI